MKQTRIKKKEVIFSDINNNYNNYPFYFEHCE